MNTQWSDLNKSMQALLKNEDTFEPGINALLCLREILFDEILSFKSDLQAEDFYAMPYLNAKGYHNKTIAYSLWHIFRIEDIVTHALITGDEQVFFEQNYIERMQSPIITTGNELVKEEIADFSRQLDLDELYQYCLAVSGRTRQMLQEISFSDLKRPVSDEQKANLIEMSVVSQNEDAFWLVDYWCKKDVAGLIRMPLSRHWIMHVEACLRIKKKLLE